MKKKLFYLFPLLCFLISCDDSDTETGFLDISQSTFENVSANGETLEVDVTSNVSWRVTSDKEWCISNKSNGENNDVLSLSILANSESAPRNATITIVSDKITRTINISQEGFSGSEAYHYQLPVVFQVLYNNEKDSNQNVTASRIKEILAACNELYNNSNSKSVDMNFEFVLATKDPSGKTLPEAGINRTHVTQAALDAKVFMSDGKNLKYIWDTNKYINIVLYAFTDENLFGIGHMPYTVVPDNLPGLSQLKFFPAHSSLSYPHCVSINNKYINERASIEGSAYNESDVVTTLAHELGHYLGLFHAFNEKTVGGVTTTDICEDTDYCKDTPAYNRSEYTKFQAAYKPINGKTLTASDFPSLMSRIDCVTHATSTPNNIMDYDMSWANRFTNDQHERIRYVLTHSPFIPGPKIKTNKTRVVTERQEFPMRMIECGHHIH